MDLEELRRAELEQEQMELLEARDEPNGLDMMAAQQDVHPHDLEIRIRQLQKILRNKPRRGSDKWSV